MKIYQGLIYYHCFDCGSENVIYNNVCHSCGHGYGAAIKQACIKEAASVWPYWESVDMLGVKRVRNARVDFRLKVLGHCYRPEASTGCMSIRPATIHEVITARGRGVALIPDYYLERLFGVWHG